MVRRVADRDKRATGRIPETTAREAPARGRAGDGTCVILASASPRRRELLALLGVPFRVRAARNVDEEAYRDAPERLVGTLAVAKAREVAADEGPEDSAGRIVLGADTVIAHRGEVLGKPRDAEHASSMLERLSGDTHEVFTGVAVVVPDGTTLVGVAASRVMFRELAPDAIARYVASGESLGKAGAYAIQGSGVCVVAALHGCYYNVVGLPLRLTARLLAAAGVPCAAYRCDCSTHLLQRAAPDCAEER